MASDKNNQVPSASEPQQQPPQQAEGAAGHHGRPIFTFTMDPVALEHEINQATQSIHSSMNSIFNSVQNSVFGGLDSLSKEMSALERSGREFWHQGGSNLGWYHQQFSDGLRKRYRITIEELPPLESEGDAQTAGASLSKEGVDSSLSNFTTTTVIKGKHHGDDLTIARGKAGTPDEGKTVITTSVAPGLLDWLLFTTHDDSFFTRFGLPRIRSDDTDHYNHHHHHHHNHGSDNGAKIQELSKAEEEAMAKKVESSPPSLPKETGPSLVDRVKQVGTSWEKDARHWWQHRWGGSGAEDANHARRGDHDHRMWGHSESYSHTTVTRPDGTVEQRTVNSLNGETETIVKIRHPDGSIEETVTRENHAPHGRGFGDRDRERDTVASVVTEAMATADKSTTAREKEQSRSWSPKTWIRRQERDD